MKLSDKQDLIEQIATLTSAVREKDEEFKRIQGETREMLAEEKQFRVTFKEEMTKILDEQRKRTVDLPGNTPTPSGLNRSVEKGGMYDGDYRVPFVRALRTSLNDPAIKGTSDAERTRHLQDTTDATVMRYHWAKEKFKDSQTALRVVVKHPETHLWARELQRCGYIKDLNEVLDPSSEKLLQAVAFETRTDEVAYPGNTNQGLDNLTFELLSAQLLDKVDLDLVVANNVRRIPLTRSQMKFPKNLSDVIAVHGTGGSNPPLETYGTTEPLVPSAAHFQKPKVGAVSFDAEHVMSYFWFNDDMLEDSIIPWLPFIRENLAEAMARGVDRMVLSGDDDSESQNHMDSDTGSVVEPDVRMTVDGLRYHAYGHYSKTGPTMWSAANASVVDVGGTAMDANDILAARKIMGKYGLNPSNLTFMTTVNTYYDMLKLTEVKTADQWGPSPTIRTGTLASIWGIPIFWSEFMPSNAATDGTEDTPTGVGVSMLWRNDRFLLGAFDRVQTEATRWAPKLYTIMQADVRMDFQPIEDSPFNDNTGPWPAVGLVNILQ